MRITLPRKTHARPILQVRGSQASRADLGLSQLDGLILVQTTCMALTEDGPVTSAEKLAWPGPRRRAGPLGPGPASDFWSVAPLEMGSIRLGFVSGAHWFGSTVPSPTRPLFSELGHHPAAPLTCATVTGPPPPTGAPPTVPRLGESRHSQKVHVPAYRRSCHCLTTILSALGTSAPGG